MWASVEDFYREQLRVDPPEGLDAAYAGAGATVAELIYKPGLPANEPPSLEWAINECAVSAWPLVPGYVPLIGVDEESFACVVATPQGEPRSPLHGQIVRWHLTTEKWDRQRDVLDTSVADYLTSVEEELASRKTGLDRMLDEIGPAYEAIYLENEKRPRDFVIRPVRLACQNVIVGLAAFAQDTSIDGLSVFAWQTAEVPHVATHDGNRAMTALMLCDAFKNGGTMEIRFDRRGEVKPYLDADGKLHGPFEYDKGHPEQKVPASLRRFARTLGVEVGVENKRSITPREARELFTAVTPMPEELRCRVVDAVDRGLATPERLCFTLMSQLWREIELDFLLAVSDRARSILEGGASWEFRAERQAESHLARAARMVGMLYRRLDTKDAAAADGEARVLEDNRVGIKWSVIEDYGAVMFSGMTEAVLPWLSTGETRVGPDDSLVAIPRSLPSPEDIELVRSLKTDSIVPVLVVPGDCFDRSSAEVGGVPCGDITVLLCPERLGELDQAIEATLLSARMTRQ